MKRTLSLVLALVMVLGTFTTVFAADEPTVAELAGKFLEDKGVLKGDDKTGDLMLEENLKRQDMVVLLSRLMGVEDVASEFPESEEMAWEDIEDPYYLPYLTWAKSNEYVKGIEEDKFGFDETVTAQDYAVLLLRVLGYEVEDHDAWETALEAAKDLGILKDVEVEDKTPVVRGVMSVMVYNALEVNMKDSDKTLAEELGIEMPVPAALEVVSVTADNLKEVKVVFNQEVDADTVVDANVKVNGLEGSVMLLEDGMTAVITVNKVLVNQGKYKVVVDKVATVNGVVIEKTEVEFTAFDATLPKVEEVLVTGPRNLTLVFSEPIDTTGKVEVKQDKLTLGNSVKVSGNKVDVQVFTNFVDGKEYTVTVKDFEDFAGYKNIINTLSFTYEKDETPPVATVEKVEQEYVVVSFNKPVKGITADKFYHTFSAWKAVSVKDAAGEAISANDSVNEVFVYFYEKDGDKGIPAGGSVFGILGNNIKDNWGNALGNQEFNVTAVADRTAPEVESIAVRAEDTVRITFSKNVKFARKNVEVLDEAGKSISGMYLTVTEVKANVYDVKMSKNMAGKTVTVSVKDVADTTLFGNVLSLHSELVEITDKTAPKVSKIYYSLEGPEKDGDVYNKSREIFVVYNEAVDAETALVATNYALVKSGKVTILSAAPSFDALNNRVKLPLTKAEANALGADIKAGNVTLQIINVKDLAGNTIVPEQHGFEGSVDLTNKVKVDVTATSKTQLVAKFDDLLSNISINNFDINDGKGFTLTQTDGATATTLTFDFAKENAFATDASGIVFKIAANHEIKNSYGKKAEFTYDNTVLDRIAPEIDKVNVDGKIVSIKFTEKMAADTFSKYSFLVDGYDVENFNVAGDTLKLELNKDFDTAIDKILVNYNLDVTDAKGNKLNVEKGTNKEYEYTKDAEVELPEEPEEPEVPSEDEEKAADVDAMIAALPMVSEITEETLEDAKVAVEAAREAYEALTPEQQELVNHLDWLEAKEAKIQELEA